jgi:hypothetical protein
MTSTCQRLTNQGENVARMGVEIGQRSVSPSAGENRTGST